MGAAPEALAPHAPWRDTYPGRGVAQVAMRWEGVWLKFYAPDRVLARAENLVPKVAAVWGEILRSPDRVVARAENLVPKLEAVWGEILRSPDRGLARAENLVPK